MEKFNLLEVCVHCANSASRFACIGCSVVQTQITGKNYVKLPLQAGEFKGIFREKVRLGEDFGGNVPNRSGKKE